jgi:hypothetical protein
VAPPASSSVPRGAIAGSGQDTFSPVRPASMSPRNRAALAPAAGPGASVMRVPSWCLSEELRLSTSCSRDFSTVDDSAVYGGSPCFIGYGKSNIPCGVLFCLGTPPQPCPWRSHRSARRISPELSVLLWLPRGPLCGRGPRALGLMQLTVQNHGRSPGTPPAPRWIRPTRKSPS